MLFEWLIKGTIFFPDHKSQLMNGEANKGRKLLRNIDAHHFI